MLKKALALAQAAFPMFDEKHRPPVENDASLINARCGCRIAARINADAQAPQF